MPIALAVARARNSKRLEQIVTVGLLLFSKVTAAWIHHVVQPPQSPIAITTVSADTDNLFTVGVIEDSSNVLTPACSHSVPASLYLRKRCSLIRRSRKSPLGFSFHKKPTTFPLRSWHREISGIPSISGLAVGTNMPTVFVIFLYLHVIFERKL